MTAVNMMVQPAARAGYVIADGAHTSPDGRLVEISPKLLYGAKRLPWAMGLTGNLHPRHMLEEIGKEQLASFKQFRKCLPNVMRRALQRVADTVNGDHCAPSIGIKGVIWDFARKRPIGFVIHSDPAEFAPGTEAFTWYETAWSITAADGADTVADHLGRAADLTDPGSFDPFADGLALVAAQRERGVTPTSPALDRSIRHRIGGDIDCAEVTKRGVLVWQIGSFKDRLGEIIDPSHAAAPLVAN
ncbi:MAG: hypothetical protein DI623_15645 [Sphingomonas sanxanigenens]|uniref:Uncharacterized protein n=1 Tax=Sphingomonas sanxanigenens TaxID=397260 RepID=A0A2W4ZXB0_9SPHN|nr:MAG: hypothetical protein DI623_15645 [Sphingomonas sanxanigenens]